MKLIAAFCGLLFVALAAQAQPFPSKAVRLVVPFPAGGSTDIISRTLGQKLSEMWGQPVVIDNRPGGSTIIGTDVVAKSAPNGYTLLVTTTPFTIVPSLIDKLPYDPAKDFEPITLINTTPLVAGRQPERAGEIDPGTDRARQGQARCAQFRLRGRRRLQPPRGRTVQRHGRREDGPHPLQRQCAGTHRSRSAVTWTFCSTVSRPPCRSSRPGNCARSR